MKGVTGAAPRISGNVEIESRTERVGAAMIGIRPSMEEKASTLAKTVERGEFLDDKDKNELLIGSSLAEVIKVDTGDTVLIHYKDRKPVEFNIKGVISTGTFDFDQFAILATYDTVEQLVEKGDATSILIRLENPDESVRFQTLVRK